MGRLSNLENQTFGRLVVVSFNGLTKRNEAIWRCRCSCGNYKDVRTALLKKGKTKSCGCLKKQCLIERNI